MKLKLTTAFIALSLVAFKANAQVKVIGSVVPNATTDKYPTHSDVYGKGGFRAVANVTERDAITPARRSEGMLVYCLIEDKFYQLKGGLLDANWVEVSLGTGAGGGSAVLALINGGTGATTAGDARTNLGLGTLSIQNADGVSILQGSIDGTIIGATTPVAGAFTALTASQSLGVTGDISATGNITANSDRRLKTNIRVLQPVSDKLRKLRAVEYDRTDMKLHQIGFIAQEVQQQFPALVTVGKDKNATLSLNYQNLVSPLLKGWQEHDTEIQQLKTEVSDLKKELEELKKLLLNKTKGQK